ncbi:hypothetical protein PCANC_05738 [Puccinia coronata f. sp. avenae]|uniref:Uncharacterized protein n=1 Tax=Puccinia coronata f. sp. avenae TaxID=200324 RepID=A0A2N5VB03_9BASI|nr:hypothetical protein PCANC_14752 [Puccinia coronata f. sp. avenae]PLW23565.1 hypothetical protein PCASD_09082 [Puccinia coronata f. sp. avenae]PLW47170.1 hypothetical protein PCASD_02312 [Puccinia coronata f. sp. avenae]PLW52887.1 hypothetical protein PCANC_05738 [Puccinia coronata f. sp. avenae]
MPVNNGPPIARQPNPRQHPPIPPQQPFSTHPLTSNHVLNQAPEPPSPAAITTTAITPSPHRISASFFKDNVLTGLASKLLASKIARMKLIHLNHSHHSTSTTSPPAAPSLFS